jgi:hypothetical protein
LARTEKSGNPAQCDLAGLPKTNRLKFKILKEKIVKKTRAVKLIFGEKVYENNEFCPIKKSK